MPEAAQSFRTMMQFEHVITAVFLSDLQHVWSNVVSRIPYLFWANLQVFLNFLVCCEIADRVKTYKGKTKSTKRCKEKVWCPF